MRRTFLAAPTPTLLVCSSTSANSRCISSTRRLSRVATSPAWGAGGSGSLEPRSRLPSRRSRRKAATVSSSPSRGTARPLSTTSAGLASGRILPPAASLDHRSPGIIRALPSSEQSALPHWGNSRTLNGNIGNKNALLKRKQMWSARSRGTGTNRGGRVLPPSPSVHAVWSIFRLPEVEALAGYVGRAMVSPEQDDRLKPRTRGVGAPAEASTSKGKSASSS